MIFTSIIGIVALVGLARVLGFAKNPALDGATAAAQAEAALPGFVAATAIVDPATRTAEVTASDGRVARVLPHGDRWVVRAG
jgi:hypothetical protein